MSSAIPGTNLNGRKPEELTIPELKRWLRCRKGASLRGNKRELVERVYLYIGHGWDDQYLFDPDGEHSTEANHVPVSTNTVESLLTYPPAGGWTRNLSSLPDLTDSSIFDYFISSVTTASVQLGNTGTVGGTFTKVTMSGTFSYMTVKTKQLYL
ncbi:uncharacterized protein [Ptychodera flava]|uniref:uncharacterized protein n=1 Tax=Ptychodera flava TaxID=63121 RepID=UPI003969CC64